MVTGYVYVRPEDGYSVSRNMLPMFCVHNDIWRVVFYGTHLPNFEITQRYGQ
jgi:hypothetical protein